MIESMAYGRLAQNPTVKKTANGGLMTVFDIASTREFGDKSGVDYARCLAFGRIGEYVAKYGAKGKGIIAMGEEQYPEYTDKNGNRQRGQQIIVSKVKFTSWDPVDGQDQNGQQPPQYRGIHSRTRHSSRPRHSTTAHRSIRMPAGVDSSSPEMDLHRMEMDTRRHRK